MEEGDLAPTLEELVSTQSLRWIFVGGKGGVGKTTTACSIALELAKRRENVLILSTDPAHNLSDAFCQKFNTTPSPVHGVPNLHAMELGATTFENVGFNLTEGNPLGKFLPEMLASIPGIDEALGFAELMQSVQAMKYSVIVFDTAPTGHTLRLLGFPGLLDKALGNFASLKGKVSGAIKMVNMVSNQDIDDDELSAKLDHIRAVTTSVREAFQDPAKTTFVCVCIPEFLSVYETERLVQELTKENIDCSNIIVNQVVFPTGCEGLEVKVPPLRDTPLEASLETASDILNENKQLREAVSILCKKVEAFESAFKARRRMQGKYIRQIEALYADDFHVVCMPQQQEEMRGVEKLKYFSSMLLEARSLPGVGDL